MIQDFCHACGAREGTVYIAREQMFGIGDRFHYIECAVCGSLWLDDPPDDPERYYPPEYYSRKPAFGDEVSLPAFITGMDLSISAMCHTHFQEAETCTQREMVIEACTRAACSFYLGDGVPRDARILDVGAGAGDFVYWLHRIGFVNTLGVDPLISADIYQKDTIIVHHRMLEEMSSGWDIILFNHSLEHVPDPVATLSAARDRLVPHGICVVRIPMAGSYAWQHYGVHWVQLDAPRHTFIPSAQGMQALAAKAGLTITKTIYDSGLFQFHGSEVYRKGLPLVGDGGAHLTNTLESSATISAQACFASLLNGTRAGDQASFVLKHQ